MSDLIDIFVSINRCIGGGLSERIAQTRASSEYDHTVTLWAQIDCKTDSYYYTTQFNLLGKGNAFLILQMLQCNPTNLAL
jgi:hypothetical protein